MISEINFDIRKRVLGHTLIYKIFEIVDMRIKYFYYITIHN